MAGAAHAAGAASIAARGISVTKEIIIATGLGLAAGGVFKARTRAVSAPQTGQPADVGAAVVEGARCRFKASLCTFELMGARARLPLVGGRPASTAARALSALAALPAESTPRLPLC